MRPGLHKSGDSPGFEVLSGNVSKKNEIFISATCILKNQNRFSENHIQSIMQMLKKCNLSQNPLEIGLKIR